MEPSVSKGTEEASTFTIRVLETVKIFNLVYIPMLCLLGALGNCLSVTVFCRPSPSRSLSASLYLSAVAFSDTGFLLTLLAVWLEDVGVPVITTSFTCPLVMYLGQVTCFLSVWFIVAFTLERFFAVCYPLTRPTICTVARAKKVVAILTLLALLGFSYVWIIATVVNYSAQDFPTAGPCDPLNLGQIECNLPNSQELINSSSSLPDLNNNKTEADLPPSPTKSMSLCSVRQEHLYFAGIASHIDSVLTLILPFGIISYLNLRIAACVWRFSVQRENLLATTRGRGRQSEDKQSEPSHSRGQVSLIYRSKQFASNDRNSQDQNQFFTRSQQTLREKSNPSDLEPSQRSSGSSTNNYCPIIAGNGLENVSKRHPISDNPRQPVRKVRANGSGYAKVEARVTKTLLLVSTVFLVLNLPSHTIRAVAFIQFFWKTNIQPDALFAAQQWANVLFNMNFSVNFLLYCASGRNFRASIKRIFQRRSRLQRHTRIKIVDSLLVVDNHP